MIEFDAIILAGGRGSRLGGLRKPELALDGRRLVDRALAAASGARRVVVVGDAEVAAGVPHTREDPPYGGPVAAVEAGMSFLKTHSLWTLILASDLPEVEAAVPVLLAVEPCGDEDGICLTGPDGRLQWLLGYYRTDALRARLADRGDPPLTAMHRLLGPLRLRGVAAEPQLTADIDTPEDAGHWGVDLNRSRSAPDRQPG